ncbi:MAG: glycosyltransferase [Candidatus Ancillula sp.]|nr:glycosyltransferase [Candidatus Ancillula sp.]
MPKLKLAIRGGGIPAVELLVFDNQSTDRTWDILEEQVKLHPEMRIKRNDSNSGHGSTGRNWGIEHASGEYISFIDSDEFVLPNFLTTMIRASERGDFDIIDAKHINVDINTSTQEAAKAAQDFTKENANSVENLVSIDAWAGDYGTFCWAKLYRREFILENSIHFIKSLGEDKLFNIECWESSANFCSIDNVLYAHTQHEDSTYHALVQNAKVTAHVKMLQNFVNSLEVAKTQEEASKIVANLVFLPLLTIHGANAKSFANMMKICYSGLTHLVPSWRKVAWQISSARIYKTRKIMLKLFPFMPNCNLLYELLYFVIMKFFR